MANKAIFQVMARLRQPVWVFDTDHKRVHWANPAALDIWNAESLQELAGRDMSRDMSPEVATRLQQYQNDFERDVESSFSEVWTLYPNGVPRTSNVVYSAFVLDDGRMGMMCELLHDHVSNTDSLRSAEALLHTPVMITLYDVFGVALYRNPSARATLQEGDESFESHFVARESYFELIDALADEGVANQTAYVNTKSGQRWHDVSARRCHDAASGDDAWLVSEVDVSDLKATEERAQFLAKHDSLTRLPNRNHVASNFPQRLAEMLERGEEGAVIFIDLDNFKDVNDTLGHPAGDQLLVVTAQRLRGVLRQGDLVARLGGDEFLVLAAAEDVVAHVRVLSKRIIDALSAPVNLYGREARVTPTLGVSLFPSDGNDLDTLMRHADLAVYQGKDHGRNTTVFFTADLHDAVQTRQALAEDIRRGLERDEFEVYFQPRLGVADNTICAAEALARWHHPTRGLVQPGEFIPMCETLGVISNLGIILFEKSVRQQVEWARAGYEIVVSINLSALQVAESNFAQTLCAVTENCGGNPCDIELEITESLLLGHDQATVQTLTALRDAGFRIAIDDFGTGYSNLANLHHYDFDCLKIDRSFISALDDASPITELIVAMAKLLDLTIVAEGVETEAQLDWLRSKACEQYQGYLFSKPISPTAFYALLQSHARIKQTSPMAEGKTAESR